MTKKDMENLFSKIILATLKDMKLYNISTCLKSSIDSNVKLGKNLVINRVKKIVPSYLTHLDDEDLKQFAKYLNGQKMRSLETISIPHKHQDNDNYAVDYFEMAICKYVEVYQSKKEEEFEKMASKMKDKLEKNEQKM